MKKSLLLSSLAFLFCGATAFGQSSSATNNSTIPPQFLGFNGTGVGGPKILDIRNDYNLPIRFWTNGTQRMQINENILASPTTLAAGAQNKSGFIGINITDPWSRLHIGGANLGPYGGYRPWMREGVTVQNANDQMWFGHFQWGAFPDQQNATINWGDDGAGNAWPLNSNANLAYQKIISDL